MATCITPTIAGFIALSFEYPQLKGTVGGSADNDLTESFNDTLKQEVLCDRKVFDSSVACRREAFRWCVRYSTRRRHYLLFPGPVHF